MDPDVIIPKSAATATGRHSCTAEEHPKTASAPSYNAIALRRLRKRYHYPNLSTARGLACNSFLNASSRWAA